MSENPTALKPPKTKLPPEQMLFNIVMVLALAAVAFLVWNAQKDIAHLRDGRLIVNQAAYDAFNEEGDEVDTKDWKTYRNEEYGFEFQYPSEWGVNAKDMSSDSEYVQTWKILFDLILDEKKFLVIDGTDKPPIFGITVFSDMSRLDTDLATTERVSFGGRSVYRAQVSEEEPFIGGSINYYLLRDEGFIQITAYDANGVMLQKVLSTFSFFE